jgi:parvulin-like peptidyl-prolyl isomerase
MTSASEAGGPDRDFTLYIWIGVAAVVLAMIAGLWAWARPEPVVSVARARHILIEANVHDPESRAAAYERAVDLRRRLREGEDFARLARQYSADPGTRDIGGDLGYAPRGAYQDAFDEYVWTAPLRQVNDEPVRTGFGYHLIEVLDRQLTAIDRYEVEVGREAVERLLEADQSTLGD